MNHKFISDNYHPAKGNCVIQLIDNNSGNIIPGQIIPLNKIDINNLPKDSIPEILLKTKKYATPIYQRKYITPHIYLNRPIASYYVITNLTNKAEKPHIVYGYAGFELNTEKKCLDLAEIFSSKHYEPHERYNVKYFGTNMIKFGTLLNNLFFGTRNEIVLHVPIIDEKAQPFYDKLNVRRYGMYQSKGDLTRQAAEELFN